jgi:serine/threonine protein phosphatase PrpC
MTSGNGWKGWGVTQTGPGHIFTGTPNQDAYVVQQFKWGIVGVVCDGLGSKKYSHLGSAALAETVVRTAIQFDFNNTDLSLFEPLVRAMWDIKIHPHSRADAATTLLAAIVKDGKVIIGKIGDGAIRVFGKQDYLIDESDDFTNITASFGRENKIEWFIFQQEDVSHIVMCTDGISEDIEIASKKEFFDSYVKHYLDRPPLKRKREVKHWLRNWPVKGHSDDKTIVALVNPKRYDHE